MHHESDYPANYEQGTSGKEPALGFLLGIPVQPQIQKETAQASGTHERNKTSTNKNRLRMDMILSLLHVVSSPPNRKAVGIGNLYPQLQTGISTTQA